MPKPSMHNARLAIAALGVDCSYDTFHNKMLFGFRDDAVRHEMQSIAGEITDNGIIRLRQLMSDSFGFDLEDKATRDAVKSLALEHCFDPVCDMLAEAEANWDGTERVDAMVVNYLNCKDTPLNRAISRKTMIAAVRRARRPGCKYDTITVLESKEGWNKSTAWRILAGDENFSDMSILGSRGREVQEQLAETWIHENADLAGMKKADIEIVKNFASRQSDDARPAYGHFLKKQKRHSIEVGTTNDSEYLLSPNGNRRFWPMEVVKMIDANAAAAAQEQRRVKDPWEDLLVDIPEWASVCDADGKEKERVQIIHYDHGNETECASSADLLTHVLKVLPARQTKSHSMQLANAMKANGWERPSGKVTIKGQRVRGYRRPWRRDPDVM